MRPVISSDVERLAPEAFAYSVDRLELAQLTAETVVAAGRAAGNCSDLTRLAEQVGLDTLAELWREAAPDTLPGALWMLYVLRAWCVRDGAEVARLYRAGRGLTPVDEVVAGAPDPAGPQDIVALADVVLAGLHRGDFGVCLERAASFFRIVAAGREHLAPEGPAGEQEREKAARNRTCSSALAAVAKAWHAGNLR